MKTKSLFIFLFMLCLHVPLFSQTCLVAHYPLDGNANDATANGNNGTITGATLTTGYNGTANGAYFFDNVDDKIDLNNTIGNFGTSDFTLSCWVKTNLTVGTGRIISKRVACSSTASYFQFSVGDGRIQIEVDGNTQYRVVRGAVFINDNEWHHVACVRTGTNYTLYVDCVADTAMQTSSVYNISNNSVTEIGDDVCNGLSQGVKFTGSLDDIRFYDCALSPSELGVLCSINGIASAANELKLNMFPNPTNGAINFSIPENTTEETEYAIYNTLGQSVNKGKVNVNEFSLDVSSLNTGIYFISLQNGNESVVKRFVRE